MVLLHIRRKSRTGASTETSGSDNQKTREREEEMVMFEGCKGFSKVDDLLKASAELLGKGSVGEHVQGGGRRQWWWRGGREESQSMVEKKGHLWIDERNWWVEAC